MKLHEKLLLGSAGAAGAGTIAWRTLFPWVGHDLRLLRLGGKYAKEIERCLESSLIDKFEKHVARHPTKVFIKFEGAVYTYEFVDRMACKVASIARSLGLELRDKVAMMITNEPAFIWTFLGLQKLGVAVAFINYNLRHGPLIHSIKASNTKCLIVGQGQDLLENVLDIRESLTGIDIYVQGLGSSQPPLGVHSFDPLMLAAHSAGSVDPKTRDGMSSNDISCLIYTSGTTGNPKPAIISQHKASVYSCALFAVDVQDTDVVYISLPLYHSAAGGLGLMGVIRVGATIVLKRKFSASQFWSDCCKYDVTGIQYIGELFRYLLAAPPSHIDTQHKVRWAFGNGLRKDIWAQVTKRFNLPHIVEFYGATEAPASLINIFDKPGAIGRLSPILNALDPGHKVLVKFDHGAAKPIRDENGRCIKVKPGEPGLFITKVPEHLIVKDKFDVYMSSNETNEKKLVRGAFEDGDIYFNTGDILNLDKDYFVYFHDRLGDTFRWKGENVSTTELSNVITSLDFIQDANVYGVSVPGHDGRAGMVALTLNEGSRLAEKELKQLYDYVKDSLPEYAQPLFVRHLDQAVLTGTFKQRKVELVDEGYDLDRVHDPLYYKDTGNNTYSIFTKADMPKLLSSRL